MRRVAVVLVLGFHAEITGFEFGFLGVDIFLPTSACVRLDTFCLIGCQSGLIQTVAIPSKRMPSLFLQTVHSPFDLLLVTFRYLSGSKYSNL